MNKEMNEKEFYTWLGQRLRQLREKAGIKQRELAEKTGMAATFLSRVENTGKKISVYQLNKLLVAMGFSQSDLTEDEEQKKTLFHSRWRRYRQTQQRRKTALHGTSQNVREAAVFRRNL